ncbi:hypothetical protein ACCO45_013850 [Purpureocillium lilacinum]|uniref:Uncharacterized protein n=1 Tax=Purpureocillium lilacinum TaxID=33203 RepID=A0ACC4DA33_PURLI
MAGTWSKADIPRITGLTYSCHEMPVVTNYKDMMPGRCFQQYGVAAECKKVYDDCCSEKEIAPWEVKECVQAKLPGRKNPDASSEAYPEDAWLSSEDPDSPASSGTTTEHEWLFPDDSTSPASSKSKSSDTWVFPDDPRLRASSEWDTERWMLRRGSQSPTNDKDDLEAPFVFPSDSDYPGMRKTKANDIKMIQRDSGSSPVVEEDPERPFVFPDERDYPDLRKTNAKDKQVFSRNPQALDSSKDDLEQPFVFPSESDYPGMGETSRKAKKPQSSKIARSATPQMRDIWQNCVVGIKEETEAFECMGVMEFDLCAFTTWSTEDCRKAILDCYRLSKGSNVRYHVGEKEFKEIRSCGARRLAVEPDIVQPVASTEAARLFAH